MRVWILMMGENGEGGSVKGVYRTEQGGLRGAKKLQEKNQHSPDWTWVERRHKDQSPETHFWDAGCDWMSLIPRAVEE